MRADENQYKVYPRYTTPGSACSHAYMEEAFLSNFVLTLLDHPPATNEDQLKAITLLKGPRNLGLFAMCLNRRCQSTELEVSGASFEVLAALIAAAVRESNNSSDFVNVRAFLGLAELLYCRSSSGAFSKEHLKRRLKNHEVWQNGSFWESCFEDDDRNSVPAAASRGESKADDLSMLSSEQHAGVINRLKDIGACTKRGGMKGRNVRIRGRSGSCRVGRARCGGASSRVGGGCARCCERGSMRGVLWVSRIPTQLLTQLFPLPPLYLYLYLYLFSYNYI